MKTNIFQKSANLFALLLFFLFSIQPNLMGQEKKFDSEVLVYFLPDSLELGKGINELVDISKLKIKSNTLKETIRKIKLKKIEKAFPDFKSSDTLKTNTDGKKIKLPNMSRIFKLVLKDKKDINETIKLLTDEKSVLFAEKNGVAIPNSTTPNDTYFGNQWSLKNGTTGRDIHATQAWDIYKGTSSNIIAIIDGGIDKTHPDLNGKVSGDNGYGWGGHGIHVAGIAAAISHNNRGVSGVDWYAKLHSQRVDNTDDVGAYNAIVDAVNYSSNVRVLNNSWTLINSDYSPRYSTTVRLAFSFAYKMNRIAVCANGNFQETYPNQTYYPAGFGQGIIAVGATNNYDNIASFSQRNNAIDVSAPGTDILSTFRNGNFPGDSDYHYENGTSMAAPHVSGIASLLKGYKSYLDNDDIEKIIQISADEVSGMNGQGYTTAYGFGRVNARKALDYLRSPYSVNHWQKTGGTVVSSYWNNYQTFYGLEGFQDGTYIVERHTVEKTVYFPNRFKENPFVWGRGVATDGFSTSNPNFTMGYCEVVPGSITTRKVKLRTYIYDLYIEDPYDGWLEYQGTVPCQAQDVVFAYTALGKLSTGIEKVNGQKESNKIINSYKLFENYPNPFNPSTSIKYQIKEPGYVSLKVYDVLGKEVASLVNEQKEAGYYSIVFNASNLTSGIYFYTMRVNDFTASKKMLLTK